MATRESVVQEVDAIRGEEAATDPPRLLQPTVSAATTTPAATGHPAAPRLRRDSGETVVAGRVRIAEVQRRVPSACSNGSVAPAREPVNRRKRQLGYVPDRSTQKSPDLPLSARQCLAHDSSQSIAAVTTIGLECPLLVWSLDPSTRGHMKQPPRPPAFLRPCPACGKGQGCPRAVTLHARQRTTSYVCSDCEHQWHETSPDSDGLFAGR